MRYNFKETILKDRKVCTTGGKNDLETCMINDTKFIQREKITQGLFLFLFTHGVSFKCNFEIRVTPPWLYTQEKPFANIVLPRWEYVSNHGIFSWCHLIESRKMGKSGIVVHFCVTRSEELLRRYSVVGPSSPRSGLWF